MEREPELACLRSVHLLNKVKRLVDNDVLQAKDMHSVEVNRSLLRALDKNSYGGVLRSGTGLCSAVYRHFEELRAYP